MSDNVSLLHDVTKAVDLSAEQVLTRAQIANLSDVMVIGISPDGMLHFETSISDGADAVWLLEKVKHTILTVSFE